MIVEQRDRERVACGATTAGRAPRARSRGRRTPSPRSAASSVPPSASAPTRQREQRASSRRRSSRAPCAWPPDSSQQAAGQHLPARGASSAASVRPQAGPDPLPKSIPASTPGRGRAAPPTPDACRHDRSDRPHEAPRRAHRGQRRLVPLRARHRDRVPRTERRRQDHHDADARRARPRPTPATRPCSAADYRDLANPGHRVGVLLDASAQHPGRRGREALAVSARR